MKAARSEPLLTGLVLLLFVGGTLWLLQRTHSDPEVSYPPLTTVSAQPDGALALYELLGSAGLEVQRFNDNEYHYPDQGCVVLMEDAQVHLPVLGLDLAALRLWVEQGGTLVLIAAGSDGAALPVQLFAELGEADPNADVIKQVSVPDTVTKLLNEGTKGVLAPRTRIESTGQVYQFPDKKPALFTGVDTIEQGADAPTIVEGVILAHTDGPLLWYRKVGAGKLYWLTRPELGANSWLGRADNHRLLLNVIAAAAQGRSIHFDEHIHGFMRESPNVLALLFRTRGGQLLLVLIGLTLLLFAGAAVRPARFSVTQAPERRQGTEMVLSQADLYRRAEARHVIADCQIDSLKRSYMERAHRAYPPSDAQLAEWIASEWRGEERHKQLLAGYLSNRLIGRGNHGLLELARAVDSAKAMLS